MPVDQNLFNRITALSVEVARSNTVMPRVCTTELSPSLMKSGMTVNIPVMGEPTPSRPVVPGVISAGSAEPTQTIVPLTLDRWEYAAFTLNDRDLSALAERDDYVPAQMQVRVAGLAEAVDQDLLSNYVGIYGLAGVPGVTPFGVSTAPARDVLNVLGQQRCPLGSGRDKAMVLDTFAYNNALGLDVFERADAAGGNTAFRTGVLPNALGMTFLQDQLIPRHENPGGTPTGWATTAAAPAGAVALSVGGGASAPIPGDIFTFAGETQTFAVTGWAGNVISFAPALPDVVPPGTALTFVADHVVNLAFERNAIAYASRMVDQDFANNQNLSWMDDVSGLTFSLELERQHFQTEWKFSCLWGSALVQPKFACRLAG